jgi:hypothetical protein
MEGWRDGGMEGRREGGKEKQSRTPQIAGKKKITYIYTREGRRWT